MCKILVKMKEIYSREEWMKMVEQAKERKKITQEEYESLVKE